MKASPESAIPDPSQTVGVLTTEHRDTWAPVYDSIVQLGKRSRKICACVCVCVCVGGGGEGREGEGGTDHTRLPGIFQQNIANLS